VQCCCKDDDAVLFDRSLHTYWVCGGSVGKDHGWHVIPEQAENGDEFSQAAEFEEDVPQSLAVDRWLTINCSLI